MHAGAEVLLNARVRGDEGVCPACSKPSSRVHSRYRRTLTYAPVAGRVVRTLLTVRRFFCGSLLSLDPVDEEYVGEGRELGVRDDETAAILLAERLANATSDRWVNDAVAGEDYMDYVRSHRGLPKR